MMRCFQGDRKMKHGKKCKIDKYTLILIVLLLLLTGLVIAWKLPQKEDRYIPVGIAVYDRSDTFMESYIRELEDKIGQTRILGKKVSYEIYDAEGIGSRQEKQLQEMYAQDYDVMLVNLVEPASAASVLTDAKDAENIEKCLVCRNGCQRGRCDAGGTVERSLEKTKQNTRLEWKWNVGLCTGRRRRITF